MGIQVRAVTRSGTNTPAGSFYGNFRNDRFNAADPVGEPGPAVPEHSRSAARWAARSSGTGRTISSPSSTSGSRAQSCRSRAQLPSQTFVFPTKLTQKSLLGRFDQNLSGKDHLSGRVSAWDLKAPFELGSTAHPSQALSRTQESMTFLASWSRVLSDRAVQEVKVGYNTFDWDIFLAIPSMSTTPQLVFPGLTIGGRGTTRRRSTSARRPSRYDLTLNR